MSEKAVNQTKILNKARVAFSIIYLMIAVALFLFFRKSIFYFKVPKDTWNFPRFIWCCVSVSLGFSAIAFGLRYHDRSPLPEYFTHYPFQLLAMATLVYSLLQIFEATSGYLFYYLSFSICFTLGYMIDQYWGFFKALIEKVGK